MSANSRMLKIYFSSTFITLFLDEREEDDLLEKLTSGESHWVTVKQKSGNEILIRSSDVVAIEKIEKEVFKSDVIAITTLAGFAGVHEITIKRRFGYTLRTVGKVQRATKETAKCLREYLLEKNEGNKSKVPSEKDFMGLFDS